MSNKNILIIEDDMIFSRLLTRYLERPENTIVSENRLQSGISRLEKSNFDIVILDLNLPDSNGLETIIKMNILFKNIPIIILTNLDDKELGLNAVQKGAQDYIVKGQLTQEILLRSIEYSIERKRLLQDMESAKKLEHEMANTDTLTKLPNRLNFYNILQYLISQSKRQNDRIAILFLDLDNFKMINDEFGHPAADKLLQQVAAKLKKCVRECDTVCRLGGDEFTIVLPKIDKNFVISIVERIIAEFTSNFIIDEKKMKTTVSIGISLYPENGMDVETLICNADLAMYRTKSEGKNNYHFFDESLSNELNRKLKMAKELKSAIRNEEFLLYYQPIVNLDSGKINGLEVLLRWNHPIHGILAPVDFLKSAEENGLMIPIERWLINTTFNKYQKWEKYISEPFKITINISIDHFKEESILNFLSALINNKNYNLFQIGLEIMESHIWDNAQFAHEKILKLKQMGITILIDNFGTGYSSINLLRELPLDEIKIDKSFIANLTTNKKDEIIIRNIILLAHELGLKIIAEGVETEAQYAMLKKLNCDEVQGYYLCKPLPDNEIIEYLCKKNSELTILNCK